MNDTEHLLTCLSEECLEVSKDIHKALRFGLSDRNVLKPDGPTNLERICDELNDLIAVVRMLEHRGILPPNWGSAEKQASKVIRVLRFMDYAREKGALQYQGTIAP